MRFICSSSEIDLLGFISLESFIHLPSMENTQKGRRLLGDTPMIIVHGESWVSCWKFCNPFIETHRMCGIKIQIYNFIRRCVWACHRNTQKGHLFSSKTKDCGKVSIAKGIKANFILSIHTYTWFLITYAGKGKNENVTFNNSCLNILSLCFYSIAF